MDWIDETIDSIDAIKLQAEHLKNLNAEIDQLKQSLAEAEAVIGFYADKRSWMTVTIANKNQRFCIMKGQDLEYFADDNQDSYCGKLARSYLAKKNNRESV